MVTACLAANARSRPDETALVHGDERVTHAELLDRVQRVAHGLAAESVGPGDAVALILPNGPAFVTAFFAVAGIGAVVVPLNPQFKEDERELCLRACDVHTVIADEGEVAQLAEYPPRPLARHAVGEPIVNAFSSGSTGRPKRLVRTHGQLWAEAESFTWIDSADRLFCAIPLFHTYGMGCCLLAAVRHGAVLVFLDEPHPFILRRAHALALLERERITVFPGVPFNFRLLADAPGDADLSTLRLCFSAGTALARETSEAFERRFGVPVRQIYGCTEAGILTADLEPDAVAGSVGRPVGSVRIRIDDGEIAVSSPAMTRGYSDLAEVNREVFRDGWFSTGDLGHVDPGGRLRVTGRKKLLIEVAGHKVDPIEVEDVVLAHPKVREAVVVGIRGGAGGEQMVKAVVVGDDGCGQREVIEFCRDRLANFKVPEVVEFREEIPKSPLGKVLRKYLV